MGALNARGVWVPQANDDLLAGWETMADQLGVYVPVASTAAARAVLNQAEAAGMGATTGNPLMFIVGSSAQKIMYTADGSKQNSKWVLEPVNKTETDQKSYTGTFDYVVSAGARSGMIKSNLPARPYDRVVQIDGSAYGHLKSGTVRLIIRVQGEDVNWGRFDTGDAQSVSVHGQAVIAANEDPDIRLMLLGGASSGGHIALSSNERLNHLGVLAFPITMAV